MRLRGKPLHFQWCAGLTVALLCLLADGLVFAAPTNPPPPDAWFTNPFTWPGFVASNSVAPDRFTQLEAVESVGRLKVIWTPVEMNTNAVIRLYASADNPGHWPARDWRYYDPVQGNARWEFKVPVDDVDVPVAYFVEFVIEGRTNISPLRMVLPRLLGIEEPTRLFWPYLEGFESDASSWRQTAPTNQTPDLTHLAHHGRRALRVALPGGNASATVGTTRVRGWQARQPGLEGLRLWLRTSGGAATATFGLHADAFTEQLRLSVSDRQVRLTGDWQRVDLPFNSFPGLELARVDWFSITLHSSQPCEVFMDDLQFLTNWATEPP